MKFSVLQQDFLPALQSVSRSVGVKSTLPVLDNILLSIEGAKLKLSATNLEIGIIKFISVEVENPGDITIPAKTLVEIISGLKQTKIEIESNGNILSIRSGKFKAIINGISASEFPIIPLSEEEGVVFKKEALLLSSQILFASAVDEGRPVLTGILTQALNGKLDIVATDGFRLAHRQIDLADSKMNFKSLIPKRTFEEVVRIISEDNLDDVKISISPNQNQVIFDFGQTIISSRLIEGNFPAWEKIIPAQIISRVILEKEDFLKSVKLAIVFAKNEANIIVLKITKDKISVESSSKELGSQENEIEVQTEGEELQIAFNAKFLLDAVSNIPSNQLTLEFSGSLSATLLKPIGVEGLEYIIMPVRLN